MTHVEIENQEIVERYVRGQLDDERRRAFQEHFFVCDECFANVQTMEQFVAGVRHIGEAGVLSVEGQEEISFPNWLTWLKPAFVVTALTTVLLTAVVAWLLFVRLPELRGEAARERTARQEIERTKQREIDELNARLAKSPQAAGQQGQLAATENARQKDEAKLSKSDKRETEGELLAQNSPIVILQATRSSEDTNELKVSQSDRRFVCWIEVGPQVRFDSFRVEIYDTSGRLFSRVGEIKKNRKNAVVATFTTQKFVTGNYLIKAYGLAAGQTSLIGEYKLKLDKK